MWNGRPFKILRKCQDQEKPGEFEFPSSVSFEKLSCVLPDLLKCSHAEMTNNSKNNIFSDLDWLLDGKGRKKSSSQDGKQMLFQLSKGKKETLRAKLKIKWKAESRVPCVDTRMEPWQHNFHSREAEGGHWILLGAEGQRGWFLPRKPNFSF